ncbi:MAG: DUF4124 domain-containing protein [Gammaproteobacteria bacterium]|nr:DUF4124 domain-containing protein [Gammaproteobacteria bacterium]
MNVLGGLFVKLLLVTGFAAATFYAVVYFTSGESPSLPDALPEFTLPELTMPELALPELSVPDVDVMGTADEGLVKAYKWQDGTGAWHYSDKPPSNDTGVTEVQVDPDANLIRAIEPEGTTADVLLPRAERDAELPAGSPVERVEQLFDSARGVEQLLEQRKLEQDRAIGGG